MELNGALSNPFVIDKSLLIRLTELRRSLIEIAITAPREPRDAPRGPDPVLATVTLVLELAGEPMRVGEIHATAFELLGRPLKRSSVKGILSAVTIGGDHRFRRARNGLYGLAAST